MAKHGYMLSKQVFPYLYELHGSVVVIVEIYALNALVTQMAGCCEAVCSSNKDSSYSKFGLSFDLDFADSYRMKEPNSSGGLGDAENEGVVEFTIRLGIEDLAHTNRPTPIDCPSR